MTSLRQVFGPSLLIVTIVLALLARSVLAAPAFGPRTSNEANVQVIVTPKPFDPSAGTWDFEVTMDTHTKPLNDDLVRVSELIVDGHVYAPTAWQGDQQGGHHRKGVLRFPRSGEVPKRIEMRIIGIGGAGVRTFKWQ
jgi:hypothetical protein